MNGHPGAPKTSVVCYFCNESFPSSNLLQGHIKQCGSILQQCSKCRAYVERRYYDQHCAQCQRREPPPSTVYSSMASLPAGPQPVGAEVVVRRGTGVPTLPSPTSHTAPVRTNGYVVQNRAYSVRPTSGVFETDANQLVKREIDNIRQLVDLERQQRELLQREMEKMKRQYSLSEERNQILLATISTLRATIEEEAASRASLHSQLAQELEANRSHFQDISLRTSQMEMICSSLQKDIEREQIERSHLELIVNGQDTKLRILNKIESDLDSIRNDLNQEQQLRREVMSHIQTEASQTKETLSREISLSKQLIRGIEEDRSKIMDSLKQHSDDISKYQLLHVDSKAMKTTVEADNIKVEGMDKSLKELVQSVMELQRLRYTSHIGHDITNSSPENLDSSGHLLWRIGDFEEKLKDSVENESVLVSPVFYTSKYGYALQAEVYLNGVGKWRGRHITASVYILPGKWDPILKWPVQLTANILLKDQTPKRDQAMDIVKVLSVRKKDQQDGFVRVKESPQNSLRGSDRKVGDTATPERERRTLEATMKKQNIFIPHTSLDKFDYIKNDTVFLEVVVTEG